jgi:hypothetical protein
MPTIPTIPALAALPSAPQRIILHWTGGGHRANAVDRRAYHYLVEGDGTVLAGDFPVAANLRPPLLSGRYAAHTGGFNTSSVGVSFCGMGSEDARLTFAQVDAGLHFVARLCRAWGLRPLDPARLFAHHEAWTLHGVRGTQNHLKQDIRWLPWDRARLTEPEVGPWIRCRTHLILLDLTA